MVCRSQGVLCSNNFPANCFIGQQLGHCNCCWTEHEGQHLFDCQLLVYLLVQCLLSKIYEVRVQRVPLLPLHIMVAWCLDLRHDSALLLSLVLPFSPHAYPIEFTFIVLTLHFALPSASLLLKNCSKNAFCSIRTDKIVSMASMLHAGSVHHLQPRRRCLQATLLHHCVRLLPVHHVSAARLTFPAFHQRSVQCLHPALLYYCHRHVHTQWYALDCSIHNSVDVELHLSPYAKDNTSYTYIASACPSANKTHCCSPA